MSRRLRLNRRNQIYSVGGGYTYGPFALGAAYLNAYNLNVSNFGGTGPVAATTHGVPGSNLGAAPSISGFASAWTYQSIVDAGSKTAALRGQHALQQRGN